MDRPAFQPKPPNVQRLRGRKALVTGGASGIGQGIALELAAHGAAVAINYRGSPDAAQTMVEEITEAGGQAIAVAADVSREDDVTAAFAKARSALGGLDLLVNNAGIEKPFELVDMPLEEWQKVIDVNLTGVFLCSREAARIMRSDGNRGVIVNITSVHEQIPWKQFSHYCASKGGAKLFGQSIARELAPHGIRVNAFAPGATNVERNLADDPHYVEKWSPLIPLGRVAEPEDMVGPAVFLASDESAYVTGQLFYVDGGWTAVGTFPETYVVAAERRRGGVG